MTDNTRLATETVDRLATEAVAKMRADLIMSHTFYGVLISQVEPVLSRKIPTMGTDGKRHYFNPDWIMVKTPNQRLATQRHESEHDARKHHSRRGNRDPKKWNIATDYAINIDLQDEGYELPPGVYVDPKYRGWSAEEIYRARELDEERQKQAEEDSEDDESEDENEAGAGGAGEDDESEPEDKEPEAGAGDEPETDEGGEEPTNGNGNGADEEGDEAEGSGGDGEAEGEESEAKAGSGEADGEAEGNGAPTSTGDPGGMGEVFDAADDEAGLAESDANWDRVVREAAALAEKRGDLPGHISRDIKREGEAKQDWRETLRAWFDQGLLKIETWSRPNRRFAAAGLILPGSRRDGVNKAVFGIDTSGSMDTIALKAANVETQAALDDGAVDEVVVVYGDTRVTRVDTYRTGDEIEFDPRGGGGTELRPMLDYIAEEHSDATLIVIITDGFIDNVEDGPEPSAPLLWAYTGYPDNVRRMMENTPWNAPAIDIGEH